MPKTTEEQARELAIEAAQNDPDQHNYTTDARRMLPWVPHRWVVNAIAKALQRMSNGTDRIEAMEQRIETLERAIPYGPGENLGALLSSHRQRIEKLEKEASRAERGAILEVAARVGKLEAITPWERIAKVERVAYETAERTTACAMRLDQLEAGRTGKSPIAFLPSHAVQRHAKAPAFVHPDHMTTITENAADNGDPMAMGIMALTKERDEYRARRERDQGLNSSTLCIEEQRRELTNVRGALALAEKEWNELRVKINPMIAPPFDGQTLGDAIAHTIQQLTLEVRSAREGGARAHDDSEQVRTALQRASKERDNALRAADKAKAQRDGVRSTVIDQAREIGELRAQLRATEGQLRIVETTAKTLAGENAEAKAERTRREQDAISSREQRLRESLGEATQLLEELAMMCQVQPIGSRATNARGVAESIRGLRSMIEDITRTNARITAEAQDLRMKCAEMWPKADRERVTAECSRLGTEVAELTEQLAMVDADRVPLRMDLDEAKKVAAIAAPFVKVAQLWCNAWLHDGYREPIDRPMSSPMVANTCELVAAHETYEKAMTEHANDIPF